MDDAEFREIIAGFRFQARTVARLRLVVVDGQPAVEVARKFGVPRQTLSNKVVKIQREIQRLERYRFAASVATDRGALEQLLGRVLREPNRTGGHYVRASSRAP